MTPGLVGYLTAVGAVLDLPDLDTTLAATRHIVTSDERTRGIPFSTRVAERLAEEREW